MLSVRSELRDYKQRTHDVNNRVAELQRQLQDAHSEKNRLEDRLLTMEKVWESRLVGEYANILEHQSATHHRERSSLAARVRQEREQKRQEGA